MDAVNQATLAVGSAPDDFVDYGELEHIPFYQLAQKWKDEDLQFLIQSPLAAILSLKLYFSQNFNEDWHRRVGDFLLNELAFYFRLSSVRPENRKWFALVESLPRGSVTVWQSWLRRQILLILDIDEELLKAIYYYYARYRKKGYNLTINDLFDAYNDLGQAGSFYSGDLQVVIDYFEKKLKK